MVSVMITNCGGGSTIKGQSGGPEIAMGSMGGQNRVACPHN
jgi:hypothetical protein